MHQQRGQLGTPLTEACSIMMTSSHGNAFYVTDQLWGYSQKFLCCICVSPNKLLKKNSRIAGDSSRHDFMYAGVMITNPIMV